MTEQDNEQALSSLELTIKHPHLPNGEKTLKDFDGILNFFENERAAQENEMNKIKTAHPHSNSHFNFREIISSIKAQKNSEDINQAWKPTEDYIQELIFLGTSIKVLFSNTRQANLYYKTYLECGREQAEAIWHYFSNDNMHREGTVIGYIKAYELEYYAEMSSKLSDLEDTYTKKLQLEGPVWYWQKRAKKYTSKGWLWFGILSGLILSVIGGGLTLLYYPPEIFKASLLNKDPQAIKLIFISATLISFIAYLVKTLSRLLFSAFHLASDAREREQLTMVYLALIKEKDSKVSGEQIKLILQSIFSRANTGLLNQESAPAMPVDYLMQMGSKGK